MTPIAWGLLAVLAASNLTWAIYARWSDRGWYRLALEGNDGWRQCNDDWAAFALKLLDDMQQCLDVCGDDWEDE